MLSSNEKLTIIRNWTVRFDWGTKSDDKSLIGWYQPSGKSWFTQYVSSSCGENSIINEVYNRTKDTVWNMVGLCEADKWTQS